MSFFRDDASPHRLERANRLVREALEGGGELAESHLAAGQLELNTGDPVRAAHHFRRAIACAPHVAEAHAFLGGMLLEAGFVDAGFARLADAIAMSPSYAASQWDVARAHALEARWDAYDQLCADLLAKGSDRLISRVRCGLWRGDTSLCEDAREQIRTGARVFHRELMALVFEVVLTGRWAELRDPVLATALAPSINRRRRAFGIQFSAELAGYCGDDATAMMLVGHAVDAGLFDLHWLERCPLLAGARERAPWRRLHGHVQRRAGAILDALYGDAADSPVEPETAIG